MVLSPSIQGDREAGLRACEKGTHSLRGNQATASSGVDVGETTGNKVEGDTSGTLVDNGKEASRLGRGGRSLTRGTL